MAKVSLSKFERTLKSLADRTTLEAVKLVFESPCTAEDIATKLDVPKINVVNRFNTLVNIGMLDAERNGRAQEYSPANGEFSELLKYLLGQIDFPTRTAPAPIEVETVVATPVKEVATTGKHRK